MTPEREKYIGGIALYEQMLRNDIAHARELMKEYKRELNEEDSNDFALDAMSRKELLARINVCKRYIMLFKRQLSQRGRNLKRCPFCGGKVELATYSGGLAVECKRCGTMVEIGICGTDIEGIKKIWNRRQA